MSSSSSSSIRFKSKKPLLSTTPKKPAPLSSSAVPTPEKQAPPPARLRNQHFALSVSDVRRTALQLCNGPGLPGHEIRPELARPERRVVLKKRKRDDLPEKYEMLCEFFGAMVNSVRLLQLKRLLATFPKLCRNIGSLTDRRFTLHHLAQLKHVMPEVIVVRKIRVHDEETNCMKEELVVTLEVDAVEVDNKGKGKGPAGFSDLKGIFRKRIADFSATHSEDADIPEGELPQLFYKPKENPEPTVNVTPALTLSHISPSFKRRFSSRVMSTLVPESSPATSPSSLLETPVKEATSSKDKEGSVDGHGTPPELASTPARLMAGTPSLRPPKRSLMSPDHEVADLPMKSAKRRSLNFDEGQISDEDDVSVDCSIAPKDVVDVLPKELFQSLVQRQKKIQEEQDPVVSQARRRHQLMAGVPKLFDMIHLLFQSFGSSVITKDQLIYKLLSGHLDIVDRREIEEQLKLLQEVAPEYISEQSSLSGDILIRLNKSSCTESIRAKLLEAR